MFYHTCAYCGANLDPGEKCDCKDKEEKRNGPPASKPFQNQLTYNYHNAALRKCQQTK